MRFLTVRQTWDPLAILHQQMQEHLNWLLESEPQNRAIDKRSAGYFPLMNLSETPDAYHLVAEVPGIQVEHLDIDISEEGLAIQCRRPLPDGMGEESFRRQERWHGVGRRELSFAKRVDPEQATADLYSGVLRMRIPKLEPARRRRIDVSLRTG